MDRLWQFCQEEVALEGPEGCNLERLWELVAVRQKQAVDAYASLDQEARAQAAAEIPELDPHRRNLLWRLITEQKKLLVEPKSAANFSDESRASTEKFKVVAPETLQTLTILGGNAGAEGRLSARVLQVLAVIARSRSAGILNPALCRAAGIEPRSLPYYMNALSREGLVVRVGGIVAGGCVTTLNVHALFARENPAVRQQEDALRRRSSPLALSSTPDAEGDADASMLKEHVLARATQLLAAAANQAMYVEDLFAALALPGGSRRSRVRFNRYLALLESRECVRVVDAPHPQRPGRTVRLARLLAEYSPAAASLVSTPEPAVAVAAPAELFADVSLEFQVWRLLALAGDCGLTTADCIAALGVHERLVQGIFERAVSGVKGAAGSVAMQLSRESETAGREKRFRYVLVAPLPAALGLEGRLLRLPPAAEPQKQGLSNTARQELVLSIIADEQVVPLDTQLAALVEARLGRACDRKTLQRIIDTLVASDKVVLREYDGRTFVVCADALASDVDCEMPANVAERVAEWRQRRLAAAAERSSKFTRVRERDSAENEKPIERLADLHARLAASSKGSAAESEAPLQRFVANPALNPREHSRTGGPMDNDQSEAETGLAVAQRYSFNVAPLARAQTLHLVAARLAGLSGANGEIPPALAAVPRLISAAGIVTACTLGEFLASLGAFRSSDALDQALELHRDTAVARLPQAVRVALRPNKGRALRHRHGALRVLVALNLLRPVTLQGSILSSSEARAQFGDTNLFVYYQVQPLVGLPWALEDLPLDTPGHIGAFWDTLRENCLAEGPGAGARYFTDEPALARVGVRTAWHSAAIALSEAQMRAIDAHVDHATGQTPLYNAFLCRELAAQLSLPIDRIRTRFRHIEAKFRRRQRGAVAEASLEELRQRVRAVAAGDGSSEAATATFARTGRRQHVAWTHDEDRVLVIVAAVVAHADAALRECDTTGAPRVSRARMALVLRQLEADREKATGDSLRPLPVFPTPPGSPRPALDAGLGETRRPARVSLGSAMASTPLPVLLRRWWERVERSARLRRQWLAAAATYRSTVLPRALASGAAMPLAEALQAAETAVAACDSFHERAKARADAEATELCARVRLLAAAWQPAPETSLHGDGPVLDSTASWRREPTTISLAAAINEAEQVEKDENGLQPFELQLHRLPMLHARRALLEQHAFTLRSGRQRRTRGPLPQDCVADALVRKLVRADPRTAPAREARAALLPLGRPVWTRAMQSLVARGIVVHRKPASGAAAALPGQRYILSERAARALRGPPLSGAADDAAVACRLERAISRIGSAQEPAHVRLLQPARTFRAMPKASAGRWLVDHVLVNDAVDARPLVEPLASSLKRKRPVEDEIAGAAEAVRAVEDCVVAQPLGCTLGELALALGDKLNVAEVAAAVSRAVVDGRCLAVGISGSPRFIAAKNAGPWQCAPFSPDQRPVQPLLWTRLGGAGPTDADSERTRQMCRATILDAVVHYPSVPAFALTRLLRDALSSGEVATLLAEMQADGVLFSTVQWSGGSSEPVQSHFAAGGWLQELF